METKGHARPPGLEPAKHVQGPLAGALVDLLGDIVGLIRDGGLGLDGDVTRPGRKPVAAVERSVRDLRSKLGLLRGNGAPAPGQIDGLAGEVAARIEATMLGPESTSPDPAYLMSLQHPRSRIRIAFLEYMKDRKSATYLELAEEVHDDDTVDDEAIRKNVWRVNLFLEENGLALRFVAGSGLVLKHEDP